MADKVDRQLDTLMSGSVCNQPTHPAGSAQLHPLRSLPPTLHPGTPSRWLSSQAWGPLGTALPVTSCQGSWGEG